MKLAMKGLLKLLSGIVCLGLLLFLPAGTFAYKQGWIFMGLMFIPMILVGAVLLVKDPELMKKRLNDKEQESAQKAVIFISAVEFTLCFVLCGLDFRFGWTHLPKWIVVAAELLQLASYALYVEVMRENAYLSRTVEVQENQQVVSTGLYGVVRHPMYFACVLLFLVMPLVLGSIPGFLAMLPFPLILVKRIQNEEKVLEEGLEGYYEYKQKVKYRMLPLIW